MKGVLFGLAVGLALAGCSSPQEIEDHARARGFEERLPEGCKLKVPGYVNGDLVVVYCDKRITTSAMRKWTTSHYNAQTQQTEYEHHRNHVIYIGPEEA